MNTSFSPLTPPLRFATPVGLPLAVAFVAALAFVIMRPDRRVDGFAAYFRVLGATSGVATVLVGALGCMAWAGVHIAGGVADVGAVDTNALLGLAFVVVGAGLWIAFGGGRSLPTNDDGRGHQMLVRILLVSVAVSNAAGVVYALLSEQVSEDVSNQFAVAYSLMLPLVAVLWWLHPVAKAPASVTE